MRTRPLTLALLLAACSTESTTSNVGAGTDASPLARRDASPEADADGPQPPAPDATPPSPGGDAADPATDATPPSPGGDAADPATDARSPFEKPDGADLQPDAAPRPDAGDAPPPEDAAAVPPDAPIKAEDAGRPDEPDAAPWVPPPPNEPGCAPGAVPPSWRNTLPVVADWIDPGPALGPSSGLPEATCAGDPLFISDPDQPFFTFESALQHLGGQWYFEAELQLEDGGAANVGVFAPPADVWQVIWPFQDENPVAQHRLVLGDVVGVAADLDAGQVSVFVNGQLDHVDAVSLLPGVGAWRIGAMGGGDKVVINLGDSPFAYGLPMGYLPWNGGAAANGRCVSDAVAPLAPVPVTIGCGDPDCAMTGYLTDVEAVPELVVLGIYDGGAAAGWQWDIDENGNPVMVDLGNGHAGSVDVHISRAGPVALVLSAYEPTDWHLQVDPGAQLVSVSLYGMHVQTVDGVPDGVPVGVATICLDGAGGACDQQSGLNFPIAPFQWPMDFGGGDTQGFVTYIETALCLPLKLFAGAYFATSFDVQ